MLKNSINQKNDSAETQTTVSANKRRALTILMTMLLVSVGFLTRVEAAAGDLDLGFGAGGKVTTDIFGGYDGVFSVLVQTDGKIVAVGNADGFCAVVRYDNLGNIDPTFGAGGMAFIGFDGGLALDAVLQTDDKIVIVGRVGGINSFAAFGIGRLDANGNADATFNGGGLVLTDLSGNFDAATAVAIQTDGKIVVAGRANGLDLTSDFGIVRYNSSGVLDGTFGAGGITTTDFFGDKDGASDVAIQTDGKIVVAGSAKSGAANGFALARYDAAGNLDAIFGAGGKVTGDYGGGNDTGNAFVIQTDGKIVVAGRAGNITNSDFGARRFNTNGSADATYGSGGVRLIDFFGSGETANGLALQTDGKLIVAGTITNAAATLDFGLARLDANGNLDAGFGAGGKVSTDFLSNDDGGGTLAVQTNGKILMGGFANNGSETDFALARYDGGATIVFAKCPLGHGYWKNHPEAWSVNSLALGSQIYSKAELLVLLNNATKTDASIILARQLIAAKLNLANGSDAAPINATIAHADDIMSSFSGKLPFKVKSSAAAGQAMIADAAVLDNYNSGLLTPVCAP